MCRRSWKFPAIKKRAASSRSCSLFRVSSEGVFLRTAILIGLVCLSAGLMGCESPAQILAINRLNKPELSTGSGAVFTRLAILENDGKQWKEILLCDEHLKNPNGFLGGTPTAGVSQWRLQFEKDPSKGLLLFLKPFNQGPNVRDVAIEVRWNPEVKRYQAMDANYQTFIGENPAIEDIHRKLK